MHQDIQAARQSRAPENKPENKPENRLEDELAEERRRLLRDLHDGLGPALVAIAYRLDVAGGLLGEDQRQVGEVLWRLRDDVRELCAEIHRIVNDLRPAALAAGLLPALRAYCVWLDGAGGGLDVTVRAPETLPELPAAVEVTAYRITTEALANVLRHSSAGTCVLSVALGDDLEIEVLDDGRGLGPMTGDGLGLASMRARAADLGGSVTAGTGPGGGTRIVVRLPCALERCRVTAA
ncbi:Histidine kinase-, DNA gyrase B-, and HSP90-like ATPase [Nonomuraea solani]|uniref:Oxygen sensor histidine kinase NreB n=1 Tax=Nonomuraea solani TaxID=1144553 RepID=A0A1H6EZF6_9ACTN|nr:ATP-binding protein [Nonomuraea solani]SEH03270.1 Histidine kinase-, DNA gyrase B-, and HSP90-like ATPase [Nonomuraea solani]